MAVKGLNCKKTTTNFVGWSVTRSGDLSSFERVFCLLISRGNVPLTFRRDRKDGRALLLTETTGAEATGDERGVGGGEAGVGGGGGKGGWGERGFEC